MYTSTFGNHENQLTINRVSNAITSSERQKYYKSIWVPPSQTTTKLQQGIEFINQKKKNLL